MNNLTISKFNRPFILVSLLAFLLLNACKKEDNDFVPKMVLGTSDSMSVPHRSGEHGVVFVANVAWKASSSSDWINILNATGSKGLDTVHFALDENEGDERLGKINISAIEGALSKEIVIVQETGISNNFFVKNGSSGEGHSWIKATNLADALAQVASGDTIFIAAGTYQPTETITNGDPGSDGDKTIEIAKNITLIGGFPADASKGAVSNPDVNKTIFSGDLGGGNAASHVVAITAPIVSDTKVTIDGITITEGNAASSGSFVIGEAKFYRGNGGGISIGKSKVLMKNCSIINNRSTHAAGAMFIYSGELTMVNSKVNNNSSEGNGAGIWAYDNSKIKIYDSEFKNNTTDGTAGAVYIYPSSTLYMYNTKVIDNKCDSYGAAVYYRESNGALVNCLITGNSSTATHGGGGLLLYGGCDVSVVSTTITGNSIPGPGGGVYRKSGTNKLSIYNSLISGNTQKSGSSDVDAASGQPTPEIKASVIGKDVYDASGGQIGNSFNAGTMLNAQFLPVGSSNLALSEGIGAQSLSDMGSSMTPPLEDDYLKVDLNGNSRTGKTIMGALVQ